MQRRWDFCTECHILIAPYDDHRTKDENGRDIHGECMKQREHDVEVAIQYILLSPGIAYSGR